MKILIGAVLAVLFITGLVQWRATSREAAAAAAFPPVGQVVDVDGVKVHAQVMGNGPDLVMIHGASGNLRDFTFDFAARISDRYRVILFDRPGLGWTEVLPGNDGPFNASAAPPAHQAHILQQAADQLGVRDPIVLGHSYGGAVALAWGLSRPEETSALVLVAAVSKPWPGDLGWQYKVTGSALGSALAIPMISAFLPERFILASVDSIFAPQPVPDGYVEHVGPDLTLRRFSMRANAQQVNSLRPHIVDMSAQYATLIMPVEVLHGTADTIVPLSVHSGPLMEHLPNGRLTTLPGLGHMPHHIEPEAVIDAIDRAASRAGLRKSS